MATAGAAAVPILLAGTGLGLTAGITGGAAAITEKIIQSRQMSEAQEAIDKDKVAIPTLLLHGRKLWIFLHHQAFFCTGCHGSLGDQHGPTAEQ